MLDGILVSDVGKRIRGSGRQRAGGLIRTALRSTDIVMDRVWQLETETFVEAVQVVTEYLAEEFTIIAVKLLSLKSGYTYEVSWTYR